MRRLFRPNEADARLLGLLRARLRIVLLHNGLQRAASGDVHADRLPFRRALVALRRKHGATRDGFWALATPGPSGQAPGRGPPPVGGEFGIGSHPSPYPASNPRKNCKYSQAELWLTSPREEGRNLIAVAFGFSRSGPHPL